MATPIRRGNGSTYGHLSPNRFQKALKAATAELVAETTTNPGSTRIRALKGRISFLKRQQEMEEAKNSTVTYPIPGSGKLGIIE